MKKQLATFALALSMLAFVGCSGGSDTPSAPTKAPTQAPTTTSAPVVTTPAPVPTEPPTVKDYVEEITKAIEKTMDESDILLELNLRTTGLNSRFAFVRNGGGKDGEVYGMSFWNSGIKELEGKEIYYTGGFVFNYQDDELEEKTEVETDEDIFDQLKDIDLKEYDEEHIDVKKTTEGKISTYTVTIKGLKEIELPDLGDEIDLGEVDLGELSGIFGEEGDLELPESISFTVKTEEGRITLLSFKQALKVGESDLNLELSAKLVFGKDAEYPFPSAVENQRKVQK